MPRPNHIVAVIGGAVSGAEAAFQLTQQNIPVVVFDQNLLPYGKIEDGLPKWHVKLRDKEEERINKKLSHPLVDFVPGVRLGRDIDFQEIACNWGFSAVLLAIGAWRDRPLPVKGIDEFRDKGLVYQNSFIYWFNHKHEPDYEGPTYEVQDGTIIVGGGLASLDVAKAIMFELVEKALKERGIETNLFKLDRSIARVLDEHDLTIEDLGIEGCTLYYRRRIKDMPLSPMDKDTPEKLAKAQRIQEKIFNNYQKKYLFKMKPLHVPIGMIKEEGVLRGLVFQQTTYKDDRLVSVPGSEKEVRASMIISSIGSIPEQINGIPMQGQIYKIIGNDCCKVEGFNHVFALGNAVTGRGNIKESMDHGRTVATSMLDQYLLKEVYENSFRKVEEKTVDNVADIAKQLEHLPAPDEKTFLNIKERVKMLQEQKGYEGDFMAWVEKHLPVRLESLVGH